MPLPLTSILVPVFNNIRILSHLWHTLRAHTLDAPYEVIFVDNHSTDPETDAFYASLEQDRCTVIRNTENLGFGKANNIGLRHARGTYIALVNSDMFVLSPWLGAMVNRLETTPACGAVQAKVVRPMESGHPSSWPTQTCGARFDPGGMPVYHLPDLPADDPRVGRPMPIQAFMGAGVLLRRALLDEIGFFDEEYDIVFLEDTDLSLRVSAHGQAIWYEPMATFYHLHSASMPHLSQEVYDRSRRHNLARFQSLWPRERIAAIGSAMNWPDRNALES